MLQDKEKKKLKSEEGKKMERKEIKIRKRNLKKCLIDKNKIPIPS